MKIEAIGGDAVWLPSDIQESELEGFLTNDNYCLQDKADGVHVLAARTDAGRVSTYNRRGDRHKVPDQLVRMIEGWPEGTLIDGEKMHEGGFVAFDMLYVSGENLRQQPYDLRLLRLADFCNEVNSPLFRVVETALGTDAKRDLVERVRAANGEGIIIKDLRSPYTPGRTAWGWSMRRLKFAKSLTAILMRRTGDTKASFEIFLLDNGTPVNVGSVSAQQYFDDIAPGQARVGELVYLYGTPNNRIVQPRLKRPVPWRGDKRAEDCTIDQIVQGGRFASSRS